MSLAGQIKSHVNYNDEDACAADLWDTLLEELGVWLVFGHGRRRDHHLVVHRGRGRLPTGTTRDDARRFGCQVNGTWINTR